MIYQAPFLWRELLEFFAVRSAAGVEAVEDGAYSRTVCVSRGSSIFSGICRVENDESRGCLEIRMSSGLEPVAGEVVVRLGRTFDTSNDPNVVTEALGELARVHPGLRLPGAFDGFEMAVRAVLEQHVSVPAACKLIGKFVTREGVVLQGSEGDLRYAFPDAGALSQRPAEAIQAIGMPLARARTVLNVAQAVASGELDLSPDADVEQTYKRLLALPGIGDWTAQYILMRAVGWRDAFPAGDLALRQKFDMKKPAEIREIAEQWRPWRAYAAMHLWM